MVEGIGERIGEDIGEGRWLTYTELAEIRGIGRESAVKLAQRERWRKLSGNSPDRTVRVLVPLEWLKPAKAGHVGETFPEGFGELSRLLSGLEDATTFVRERADAAEAWAEMADADRRVAEARADAERTRADRAEDDRRAAEARAERAEQGRDGERARADALRDRLNAMQEQLADAHAALQAAEAADARAKQAEAGRAEERGRADRAEATTTAERGRADELRERIEALQVQITARQEVIDAAEATRRAEDERRARGLVARLRAAWRGE
jgi:hypothetical protein